MPLVTDLSLLLYETLLNLDYCFIYENLWSHVLYLPSIEGLSLKSDYCYALSLILDSGSRHVLGSMLRLPCYYICLLDYKKYIASIYKA
jgi:hypothetical protein